MPGHNGHNLLGMEALDITEIPGADSLYEAAGIIAESEKNAGQLFGANTFYSTEGSSQCIRAILYLALLHAKHGGKTPRIAAGRNAHKTFLSAAALLDLEVQWLYGETDNYLSCPISAEALDRALTDTPATAVYLTSPDYLGNTADLSAMAQVCHRHGALLLVDNAHGAYLKFLPESKHPIDLGADICCDSAHKTLPVLTGGAYLHISRNAPEFLPAQAKNALALFGSTSPSYLILQSLDRANKVLAEGYRERLAAFVENVNTVKHRLAALGYAVIGDEPLKITLKPKPYGYTGQELAEILRKNNIVCEFCDPDFAVMMATPETGAEGLNILEQALFSVPKREEIRLPPPEFQRHKAVLSIRRATLCESEILPVRQCLNRILSTPTVGCPPAVPILACGERITEADIKAIEYYGIQTVSVCVAH